MYKGPFKWWVQSVMPVVFDDSLSYYEVLAKLTKYIEGLTGDVQEIEKILGTIEGIEDITEFTKFLETIKTEIGNLDNLQTANKDDLVSAINEIALKANNAYVKPSGGIPESDLSQGVQDKLNRTVDATKYIINNRELKAAPSNNSPADLGLGTYSVPAGGIPWDTLSQDVQDRINAGGGGTGGTTDYTDLNNKPQINGHTLNAGNNTADSLGIGTYNKPSTGIPESDLSTEVQEKLNTSGGIADSETSFVATRDYEAGELIYINGILYKTKYKILNGTNLIPGNNIEATDISNEIEKINSDIEDLQSGSGPDSWNLTTKVKSETSSEITNFFEYFNCIGGENYNFILDPIEPTVGYSINICKRDGTVVHSFDNTTYPIYTNRQRFTFTPNDTGEYYCTIRRSRESGTDIAHARVTIEYTQSQGISELWAKVNQAASMRDKLTATTALANTNSNNMTRFLYTREVLASTFESVLPDANTAPFNSLYRIFISARATNYTANLPDDFIAGVDTKDRRGILLTLATENGNPFLVQTLISEDNIYRRFKLTTTGAFTEWTNFSDGVWDKINASNNIENDVNELKSNVENITGEIDSLIKNREVIATTYQTVLPDANEADLNSFYRIFISARATNYTANLPNDFTATVNREDRRGVLITLANEDGNPFLVQMLVSENNIYRRFKLTTTGAFTEWTSFSSLMLKENYTYSNASNNVLTDLDNAENNKYYNFFYTPTFTPDNFPVGNGSYRQGVIFTFGASNYKTQVVFISNKYYVRLYSGTWGPWRSVDDLFTPTFNVRNNDSLVEAINSANALNRFSIIKVSGTHDMLAELMEAYPDTWSTMNDGRGFLIKDVHLIFDSQAKIVCNYDGDDTNVLTYFSVFDIRYGSEVIFENVNIEASRIRYCVHDDRFSSTSAYKNSYINCKFKLDNSGNNLRGMYPHCIGGGFGQNSIINIDGCIFEGIGTAEASSEINRNAIVSWHNSPSVGAYSKLYIHGCYFKGDGTFRAMNNGPATIKSDLIVCNNSFGSAPYKGNIDSSAVDNMEMMTFNNEIRNA